MNIRPLYDRIVVKRIEEKETTHRGIIIPDSAKEKPQEAEVMAIGKGKRLDDGEIVAHPAPPLQLAQNVDVDAVEFQGFGRKHEATSWVAVLVINEILTWTDGPGAGFSRGPGAE